MNEGKCRNGDSCQFAHGDAELKTNQAIFKMRNNEKNTKVAPAGLSLESLGVQHANLSVQNDVIMAPPTGNADVISTAIIAESDITTIIASTATDSVLGLVENEDDRSFASSSSQVDKDEDHPEHDIVHINSDPPSTLHNTVKPVLFESTPMKKVMTFSTSLNNNGVPSPISVSPATAKLLPVATITRQPTSLRRPFNEITKTPPKDASAASSASPPVPTPLLRHESKLQKK